MEVTNKQYFHCSVCGKTSTVAEKIKECEASHIKVDENKPLKVEYGRNRPIYPSVIGVPMLNGKIAMYSFIRAEDKKS